MEDQKLKMSFDPNTISHLGVKMYSNLPNALAELIANAYDADAGNVEIKISGSDDDKSVSVIDDGTGMSFDEVNDNFLRIGKNRRLNSETKSLKGRFVTGRKGLGKLALFGIGTQIDIETTKKGEETKTCFVLDWDEIQSCKNKEYEPSFKFIKKANACEQGTCITLRALKRKSSIDPEELAGSLAKLFGLFDKNFKVVVKSGAASVKVDQDLRYQSLEPQFTWSYEELCSAISNKYNRSGQISGVVYSTDKPLKPGFRGITLFARGRMVNKAEFFDVAESSHAFSYITGFLNIDFIDDGDDDFIATDRQSLAWELPETMALRGYLRLLMNELKTDWSKKRKESKRTQIKRKTGIDVSNWVETVPSDVGNHINAVIEALESADTTTDEDEVILGAFHGVAPEYCKYHWRRLHPSIKEVALYAYKRKEFFSAFMQAVIKYLDEVREKSGFPGRADRSVVEGVFAEPNPSRPPPAYKRLLVAKNRRKSNGRAFYHETISNIEEGHRLLSKGIVVGGRNISAHDNSVELSQANLFTEDDCLDSLSLLSHLFRRLDGAEEA